MEVKASRGKATAAAFRAVDERNASELSQAMEPGAALGRQLMSSCCRNRLSLVEYAAEKE